MSQFKNAQEILTMNSVPSSDCFFNFIGRHFFRLAETFPLGDSGESDFNVEDDVSSFSTLLLLLVDSCCKGGTAFFSKLVRVDSYGINKKPFNKQFCYILR